MKTITFNRITIAFVLIYFPVVSIGQTGSLLSGLDSFALLVVVLYLGFIEGRCGTIAQLGTKQSATSSAGAPDEVK